MKQLQALQTRLDHLFKDLEQLTVERDKVQGEATQLDQTLHQQTQELDQLKTDSGRYYSRD